MSKIRENALQVSDFATDFWPGPDYLTTNFRSHKLADTKFAKKCKVKNLKLLSLERESKCNEDIQTGFYFLSPYPKTILECNTWIHLTFLE